MGTPDFAVPALNALVEAGHDIVAVYSQPPRPAGRGKKPRSSAVQTRAEALDLEVRTPTSLKSDEEKAKFANKVADFCNSIYAINKIISEDGKQKIGVYVVLDDKENINQQTVFDAMERVSEMYEKTARFLMKTF